MNQFFPADQQEVDEIMDLNDEEIEQAYLDWEDSLDYQIEDLGVEL